MLVFSKAFPCSKTGAAPQSWAPFPGSCSARRAGAAPGKSSSLFVICHLRKAKEQSQLNRAVFETCPGVSVSVEQQVLLSCAGSVCFSNQIQRALWSLLEGKDSSRLCSLGASWNPASTHNSLGLSSRVERCSLRRRRLYQKFHCIVIFVYSDFHFFELMLKWLRGADLMM